MSKPMGERLQSLPRELLFLVLIISIVATLIISHFGKVNVPNRPADPAIDFFAKIMTTPLDKPVLIQTDWTNSSRGESGGQFEALIRMVMRRGLKFAMYSGADPQAPQVARDVISRINAERKAAGQLVYQRWDNWIDLGYFPDVAAMNKSLATNARKAFSGRKDAAAGQPFRDVFQSPVLKGVQSFNDFGVFVLITASNTSVVAIERLSDQQTPILMAVTGVMGPETAVYYSSRQIKGLSAGLKGVYDIETLMEYGINSPNKEQAKVKVPRLGTIEGFPGQINFGKGGAYYPTLHVALTLLILAVIIGNVGMMMSRKRAR